MNPYFHQFTPQELYISIADRKADANNLVANFNITGCTFLDAFVGNIDMYGYHTAQFHAKMLGISRTELCFTVLTLTGMTYTNFMVEYILLMIKDRICGKKADLNAISKQLGFGSYSGFYRFVLRNMKDKPSWL